MADQIPPGRPGNLTIEEESKLREFWRFAAQVGGLYKPPTKNEANSQLEDKEKRRSRWSIFGRSIDSASEPPHTNNIPAFSPTELSDSVNDDENDKHGQVAMFKKALKSMTAQEFREAFWSMTKHDHPDALLLRFLRARKWDVNAAVIMAISAIQWRLEFKLESDVMYGGEEAMFRLSKSKDPVERKAGRDFMSQLEMGKAVLLGNDRQGRPIVLSRVRLHHPGDQSQSSIERLTVQSVETVRLMISPPVDTAMSIFDMTGFGLSNMDNAPLRFIIKCFEANYPESLGCLLVHQAPWIFQGIWKIIKGWLDPDIARKIHFTNTASDLEEFIEPSLILKEWGGEKPMDHQYIEPRPGENSIMEDMDTRRQIEAQRLEWTNKYEEIIIEWIGDDDWVEKRDKFRERRDQIAQQLHDNYWELDPYIRARCIYDRLGLIQGSRKD